MSEVMDKKEMLVPELRFKEFEEQWAVRDFNSMVKKRKEKFDPKKTTEALPCIELESIQKEKGILLEVFNSEDQSSIKNKFYQGDVLLGKLRPKLKKYLISNFEGVCSSEIWVLNGKNSKNEFIYYLIQTNRFYKSTLVTSGSKMPRADWEYISTSTFSIPSLPEQQKIADFLSAVDQKIQQLQRKKELLAQYKKGMMQKLFTQQIRFKPDPTEASGDEQGNDFPEWEEKSFGEVFERVKRKNKENNQNVLTISAQQGLINQVEYFNHSVSAKDLTGYYLLKKGEFAYNKSYSKGFPMGAIKRLDKYDKGVVSTLYICFRIIENDDSTFYKEFLDGGGINHEIHKIAQEGARNHGLLNMSVVEFFKDIVIPRPSVEEQTKIGKFLNALSAKVVLAKNELDQAERFKKGLLQKMFV